MEFKYLNSQKSTLAPEFLRTKENEENIYISFNIWYNKHNKNVMLILVNNQKFL